MAFEHIIVDKKCLYCGAHVGDAAICEECELKHCEKCGERLGLQDPGRRCGHCKSIDMKYSGY
jgi:hypothetical protein